MAEETIQARKSRLASVPRACEGCKIRKIRCDRTVPCANCQASKIACRHPIDKARHQAQADRIADLEAFVKRLDERLRDIEARPASHPATAAVFSTAAADEESIDRGRLFEGDSSFTRQSLQASSSAEIAALCSATGAGDVPAIKQSLKAVRETLYESSNVSRNAFRFATSTVSEPPRRLLSPELVRKVLGRMKERRPIFLSSYVISDIQLFESLCLGVYQSNQPPVGHIASVHGVLFCVLKEYIAMNDGLCQHYNLAAHLDQCEQLFISAIETYEVLVVPSFENVLALTMGAIKAQGEAKPSLFWALISAAVTQCQSLGYHREATHRGLLPARADATRRLFWAVYIFETNISLLLGRASSMQGLLIDTEYPAISRDPAIRPWDESLIMGIRLAGLQNRIFVGLYAAGDPPDHTPLVTELDSEMQQWHFDLEQIQSDGVNHPQVFNMSRGNWDISYYSSLTLLHYASFAGRRPGRRPRLSLLCINAARNALSAHLSCFPQFRESQLLSDGEYFNWILLFSSLTPFLVIFLHAITDRDPQSVTLLERVLGTLETVRSSTPGTERLYSVFETFAHLARSVQAGNAPRPSTSTYAEQAPSVEAMDFSELIDMDDPSSLLATDVLDDWLGGRPFLWNHFDVEPDWLDSGAGAGTGAGAGAGAGAGSGAGEL
ncbi:hypothetical protein BDV18DRAFT_156232 [Aspergillus unguis]